jgi:hypothetical protein
MPRKLWPKIQHLCWVLLEPVLHVGYLIVLYSVIRVRTVGDLDTAMWLMVGLQAYFIFRKTADRVSTAANENSALYAYRQVKPIDTLFARALLEGAMNLLATTLLAALLLMMGHVLYPDFPLGLLQALFGMWMLGIGLGMSTPEDPAGDGFLRVAHMGHVNAHMTLGALAVMEAGMQALSIPHGKGALEAAPAVVAGAMRA